MPRRVRTSRLALTLCLIAAAAILMCSCGGAPEQRYARFFHLGMAKLNKHDYPRAILQFKNAILEKPKSSDAYYELGMAYLGAKEFPAAIKCLRETLQLNPKDTAAKLKLAELAIATHDPAELEQAEQDIRRILEISPENVDALDVLANAEWQLGKAEDAEKLLSQAFAQSPHDPKVSLALAKLKLSKKDASGAEEILEKLVANNPGSADAAAILGRLYIAVGRVKDAQTQFERALKLDAENGAALVSLAAIRWQEGKADAADQLYKRAAALSDPQFKSVHALFLLTSGKQDAAILEFEKIYRHDPSDRASRTQLIGAYEATNRGPEAERVIAAALKDNPKDVNALMDQSAIDLRNGNTGAAEAALATALHFQPDSAQTHYLLAALRKQEGKTQMQRQELAEAVRLNPNFLPARLKLAELLIANKAANEARGLLNETPTAQRNNPAVLTVRNWAALALGDKAEARSGVDKLLMRNRPPDALVQDGILNLMDQQYAAARKLLDEALQKSPDNSKAMNLMVQSYEMQKQLPLAVQWLREYAARTPKSAAVQFELGKLLAATGDPVSAHAALSAARSADPELTAVVLFTAHLDIETGNFNEARKILSELISKNPASAPAHLLLGDLEETARNHKAAIEQYRKAAELDAKSVEALNDLAYVLAEFGKQPDEALRFAQKAEELAPENPAVSDTLGWVLYRKALYASAIPYLEQAAVKQPTGLRQCHLALAYIKFGSKHKGEQLLAAALRMDPSLSHSELVQEIAMHTNFPK